MTPVASLQSQLFNAIKHGDPNRFDSLALEVFAYQYAHNLPYRAFCDRRSLTPDRIDHWRQIPAVPTTAFKVAELTCRPDRPSTLFLTSGTTQGQERRGRHLVADLAFCHAAILSNAQAHLFPDLPLSGGRRLLMLSLTPPPSQRPNSSLIHMIDLLMQQWGSTDSRYLGTSDGLDGEALRRALRRAVDEGTPAALFGTTAAFMRWFEQCDSAGWRVVLPAGSRLMDTGGLKGVDGLQSSSMKAIEQREIFLAFCERLLGLPTRAVVNEYGMTELGSQFYSSGVGMKVVPPWVRVRLIDPATNEEAPSGEPGLVCVYDLANLHSVMAIQTDDLGIKPPGAIDGFQLLGRVAGAEPRGCSLDPSAALLGAR